MKHRYPDVSIAALLAAALATPASGQTGLDIRGRFHLGRDHSAVTPCGFEESYWVTFPDDLQASFAARYAEAQSDPSGEVYVQLRGWLGTTPPIDQEAGYAGTLKVIRIDSVGGNNSCGGSPLGWVDGVCPQPATPTYVVHCAIVAMVEADRTLRRYVTAAWRRSTDQEAFFAAAASWEAYRDRDCAAYAEEAAGATAETSEFVCRTMLSTDRAAAIWDQYLRGTDSTLPDPRDLGSRTN